MADDDAGSHVEKVARMRRGCEESLNKLMEEVVMRQRQAGSQK